MSRAAKAGREARSAPRGKMARGAGTAPVADRTTGGRARKDAEGASADLKVAAAPTSPGVADGPAPTRPFARRRSPPDASTPEGYRSALAYDGKADETTFRAVARRTGCDVREAAGKLEAWAGLLLMGRFDLRSGRTESRHDFPEPEPLPPGRWEVEVRDGAGPDGLTPFRVRWTSRATGRSDDVVLLTDLDAFVEKVSTSRTTVGVTGHDGSRRVVTAPRDAWEAARG